MEENPIELGDLECDVMQLVWARGPLTSEAVREGLSRPLKESTIRTVLKRLEDKSFVRHSVRGRTFVFVATETRRDVAARAVRRIADRLCNGSVEEVLAGMANSAMLDPAQLRNLAKKIKKAKRRKT
jgi:BlaI family penicillinase repressor